MRGERGWGGGWKLGILIFGEGRKSQHLLTYINRHNKSCKDNPGTTIQVVLFPLRLLGDRVWSP